MQVLRHDSDSLGMNSAKVGVFEQSDQISFSGFLECQDCLRLESDLGLTFLSNFLHQSLERKLSDQEVSLKGIRMGKRKRIKYRFLESSDFTQCYGSWSEFVWLFHSACNGCRLTSSLSHQMLSWNLCSCCLSCSLFSSCHFCFLLVNGL